MIHPIRLTLPVYVANFVLMDYGTGAISVVCPATSADLDFANKYGRPVIPVFAAEGRGCRYPPGHR